MRKMSIYTNVIAAIFITFALHLLIFIQGLDLGHIRRIRRSGVR